VPDVPTIPTPFIGGAEGPQRDRTDQANLQPPFFTEAAEPENVAEPGAGAATRPTEAEAEAESPFFLEPEPAEEPTPAPEAVPDRGPALAEEEEVARTAAPERDYVAESVDEALGGPSAPQRGEDEDLPDYLFGADTPPPFSSAEGAAATPPLPESPELLAHRAEELLDGPHGDRIRDLVASLGSAAAEVAITRAFAAGYLAAKRDEER
jgi:hypothetical protein